MKTPRQWWEWHYCRQCGTHVFFPVLHWVLHSVDLLKAETARQNALDQETDLS